jgi:hypothetical protein
VVAGAAGFDLLQQLFDMLLGTAAGRRHRFLSS